MNIGIVTTWFERGAAYVSRQYEKILEKEFNVFIYARGGEERAVGDSIWDKPNVEWDFTPNFGRLWNTLNIEQFKKWLSDNQIDVVLFNEQVWWEPVLYCAQNGIKTVSYIDYYKKETVDFFNIYDALICNTKRHYGVFKDFKNTYYIPWGTDINLFLQKSYEAVSDCITFFHSYGYSPQRKGTEYVIKAFENLKGDAKLVIQGQVKLEEKFPDLKETVLQLTEKGKLIYISKTVKAPGLFHLGDVYVYPTLLDGIGLTQAEALSCGLPIIVPDCPPMNEFACEGVSKAVKIDEYKLRGDNYYWPMCYVNIDDLTLQMQYFVDNFQNIKDLKMKARKYALRKLDWTKNSNNLCDIFKNIELIPWKEKEIYLESIIEFDKKYSDDGKLKLKFAEKIFSIKRHKNHIVFTFIGMHLKVKNDLCLK